MNLKRFDCEIYRSRLAIYSIKRDYNKYGDMVDCENLIDWIIYQQYELGLSKEEVLDKLMRELS